MGEETAVRKVKVGQKFTIDLEAMPGAGYMWMLAEIPSQLELVNQGIISTSKEIGGSSTQRFTLVAHQPGTFSISFVFKRKWEKSAAKTAVFSVEAN